MKRSTAVYVLALAALLFAVVAMMPMAHAQPATAASAPEPAASEPKALTRADVKPTACGEAGIGEVWAGPRRGQIEARAGKPRYRVNEAGFWSVGCKMPPPPIVCPERAIDPAGWGHGRSLCSPALSSIAPGRIGDRRAVPGIRADGKVTGQAVWVCFAEGWALREVRTCN